jgi:small subunit ribosomal protein S1
MCLAGEIMEGQVRKLVPFGGFVRVAQGIEGLVHISELSDQHVESPEAVLSVGDTVRVKVIDVDISRRRISLSMRQVGGGAIVQPASDEIQAEAPAEPEVGADTGAEPEAAAEPEPAAEFAATEAAVEAAGEPDVEAEPAAVAESAPVEEQAETESEVTTVATGEPEPEVSLESILEDLKRREGRTD